MSNAFLYVVTVLIWGTTWFAIEFQLGVVAPEVSIFYRYLGAALILFAWSRYRHLPLRYGVTQHAWFVVLGLLLFGINYVLAYKAQVYISSALTAIAFSTILWMNIVNARLFFGVHSSRRVLIGGALGIAGVVILFAPQIGELSLTDSVVLGSSLSVLSALVASFGNMASQAAQKAGLPVIQSNAWGMFYGALFTGAYASMQGLPFNFELSTEYVISLAYLTVFGSIIAFGAYLTLLGRIGAHKAGYSMVMFPVVALILSVLFEGLRVGQTTVFGIALVLMGNLFILQSKAKSSRKLNKPSSGRRLSSAGVMSATAKAKPLNS
jgi:drug/metabolite transporter (DMT)-like permease